MNLKDVTVFVVEVVKVREGSPAQIYLEIVTDDVATR